MVGTAWVTRIQPFEPQEDRTRVEVVEHCCRRRQMMRPPVDQRASVPRAKLNTVRVHSRLARELKAVTIGDNDELRRMCRDRVGAENNELDCLAALR